MKKTRVLPLLLSVFLLVSVLLAACAQATPAPIVTPDVPQTGQPTETAAPTTTPQMDQPRLRILNSGQHDIKNLTVLFPESRIVFGDVPAGTTSEYQVAPGGVYNYAAYEYEINGETYLQPVIDWMGESPRPGASYTYELALKPDVNNDLRIELVQVSAP